MAYIYKIVNDINDKLYIGKTQLTVEERFREHCRDAFKINEEKRPLYAAMRKYGIEHFHIEQIEETDNPNEREQYWIEFYGSFKYGYNATLGGDGKRYCDYDLVYVLYQEGKTIKEIAQILNYDPHTCRVALDEYEVSHEERKRRGYATFSRPVLQINKDTDEIITIYPSVEQALKALGKQSGGHIAAVCSGSRKTAYGYKWRYGENE